MPETCLGRPYNVFNPGIGTQFSILQKFYKGKINHERATIPILCVLSEMSKTCNDSKMNHDLIFP